MCGCGGNKSNIVQQQEQTIYKQALTSPEDCFFTKDILETYKTFLQTVKEKSLYDSVSMNTQAVNSFIGLIQSALNYPDNYCLFEVQLNNFKDKTLPKLIEHVSEYID